MAQPDFDQILAVMAAASQGESSVRVPFGDDLDPSRPESRLAVALNLALIPMLFRFDEVHGKQSWQLTLGGIAYPLFIVHWFIGTVVLHLWSSLTPKGAAHFLVSLAASLAVSLVLYLGIDRNVEKVRSRLKRRPIAVADAAWAGQAVKPS